MAKKRKKVKKPKTKYIKSRMFKEKARYSGLSSTKQLYGNGFALHLTL